MEATTVVELVGATCLVATGASHWFHAEMWCRQFESLAARGPTGARINGLFHGAVGGLFVALHPVFAGWNSVFTYWALAVAVKGALYLVAPRVGLRAMVNCTPDKAPKMRWAGVAMAALGLVVAGIAWAS